MIRDCFALLAMTRRCHCEESFDFTQDKLRDEAIQFTMYYTQLKRYRCPINTFGHDRKSTMQMQLAIINPLRSYVDLLRWIFSVNALYNVIAIVGIRKPFGVVFIQSISHLNKKGQGGE
jgi:hypothetical protein